MKEKPESQSERFKQAARELGCDDDPERFKETVRKLANAGPQHKAAKADADAPVRRHRGDRRWPPKKKPRSKGHG